MFFGVCMCICIWRPSACNNKTDVITLTRCSAVALVFLRLPLAGLNQQQDTCDIDRSSDRLSILPLQSAAAAIRRKTISSADDQSGVVLLYIHDIALDISAHQATVSAISRSQTDRQTVPTTAGFLLLHTAWMTTLFPPSQARYI